MRNKTTEKRRQKRLARHKARRKPQGTTRHLKIPMSEGVRSILRKHEHRTGEAVVADRTRGKAKKDFNVGQHSKGNR